jgi:hypothetical protein
MLKHGRHVVKVTRVPECQILATLEVDGRVEHVGHMMKFGGSPTGQIALK